VVVIYWKRPVESLDSYRTRVILMKNCLLVALACLLPGMGGAFAAGPRVTAPTGAKLLLRTSAQGVQIYKCQKADDGYHWVFSAPDAALFDAMGQQVGTHFAGPTWQMQDGSKIVGEVVAQAPAPEPHAIGWLLLRVKSHDGNGVLSGVELVRRIDTLGGTAPAAGCDADHASAEVRMRYMANYLFYAGP
jgi:hypothetical protein